MTLLTGKTESRNRVALRVLWADDTASREQLPPSARALLIVFSRHANMETGEVCLSQGIIEQIIGISDRTARTMSRVLLDKGLIQATGKSRPGKVKGHIPIYAVTGAKTAWGLMGKPDAPDIPPTTLVPGAGQMEMVPVGYTTISRNQAELFINIAAEAGLNWGLAKERLFASYQLDVRAYRIGEIPAAWADRIIVALKEIKEKELYGWSNRERNDWITARIKEGQANTDRKAAAPNQENYNDHRSLLPPQSRPVSRYATDAWEATKNQLELQLPRNTFDTWIKNSHSAHFCDDKERTLLVSVESIFIIECLEQRLYQCLLRTLRQVTGQELDLSFTVPADHPCWEYLSEKLSDS